MELDFEPSNAGLAAAGPELAVRRCPEAEGRTKERSLWCSEEDAVGASVAADILDDS